MPILHKRLDRKAVPVLPTVSVIVPYYNRAHCIRRAIDSILKQSLPPAEIIIVDDASSDNLKSAVAPVSEHLTTVRMDINRGAAAARNFGIRRASGDYVAFLDSDDWWKPEKLRHQFDFMKDLSLSVSCTAAETVLESGQIVERWRPYPPVLHGDDFAWGCYVSPGSTLVAPRERLLEIGGYDEQYRRFEDWDMLLRLAQVEPAGIGFLPAVLAAISKGSSYESADAQHGLDKIVARHLVPKVPRSREYSRRLRAGVAFNRAALYKADNRWAATALELFRCFAAHPKNNLPLEVILRGRITNRAANARKSSQSAL